MILYFNKEYSKISFLESYRFLDQYLFSENVNVAIIFKFLAIVKMKDFARIKLHGDLSVIKKVIKLYFSFNFN